VHNNLGRTWRVLRVWEKAVTPAEEANGRHPRSQHHYRYKRRHPSKASTTSGSHQEWPMAITMNLRTKTSRSLQNGKDPNQHTKEVDGSHQRRAWSLLKQGISSA